MVGKWFCIGFHESVAKWSNNYMEMEWVKKFISFNALLAYIQNMCNEYILSNYI